MEALFNRFGAFLDFEVVGFVAKVLPS